jgi:glycosyltransferase involved in cell wall biosynthesis
MISFIVPAYNEERLLERTVHALLDAGNGLAEPYEIIVVDDASSDSTASIARDLGVRVVCVNHRQIASTRNSGAKVAKGDFFIFVDADTVVTRASVSEAVRAMRQGVVGGGAMVRFDGSLPTYARFLIPLMAFCFRAARLASGCFLFCTRAAFETTGGFDESLYGSEEIAMSRALKHQGRFIVLHEEVITSGRKLRAHTGRELLCVMGQLAFRGSKAVKERRGMEIWYEGRRDDPEIPVG